MAALFGLGARAAITGARIGSTAARTASAASRAGSAASRSTRTFSVAGKSGPVSRGKGFKPPTKPKPKPAPKPKPGEKPTTDPTKKPQNKDGMSATDGVSTAAGAIPPGGFGQSSGYGNMASSMAMSAGPGLLSTGLSAGMGAAGAFATSAAEGTSADALERASEKGTRKGQNAADTAADALAAATSGSIQTRVSGKTSGVLQKHEKTSCPCDNNIKEYQKIQRGLPEGLKQTIAQYYTLASTCKCKKDNEEQAKDLRNKILASKNELTMNGRPFSRTDMFKRIAMTQKRPSNIQRITQNIKRGGYMRLAGTRKKARGVIHKKSITRKQRPQKTQSRRRTRKN
jgi:hypothetical protein